VINSVEALKTIFVAVVYKNQQSGRVIVFSILKIEKKNRDFRLRDKICASKDGKHCVAPMSLCIGKWKLNIVNIVLLLQTRRIAKPKNHKV